jgi:hypothetical protein
VSTAIYGGYDPYTRVYGDMEKYITLGLRLSRGEGFGPTAFRASSYPIFLSILFRVVGYHLHLIVFVQAFVSALSAVFIYLAARALRPATATLAFLASVLYYPFWLDAAYLLTETLLTCLTAAALWAVVEQQPVAGGVLAGLTVLTKSVTWPFWLVASRGPTAVLAFLLHRPWPMVMAHRRCDFAVIPRLSDDSTPQPCESRLSAF